MTAKTFLTFMLGVALGLQSAYAFIWFLGVPKNPGPTTLVQVIEWCGVKPTPQGMGAR